MAKITFGKSTKIYGFYVGTDENMDYTDAKLENSSAMYSRSEIDDNNTFIEQVNQTTTQLYAIYKASDLQGDKFCIYRKSKNDASWQFLGQIDGIGASGIDDLAILSGQEYMYLILPKPSDNQELINLVIPYYIKTQWDHWTITDVYYDADYDVHRVLTGDPIFRFDKNINVGAITNNTKLIRYETLGRFNKIINTNQNFKSGTFSAMFNDMTQYQDPSQSRYDIYNLDKMVPSNGIKSVTNARLLTDILYDNRVLNEDNWTDDFSGAKYTIEDLLNCDNKDKYDNVLLTYNNLYYQCNGITTKNGLSVLSWKLVSLVRGLKTPVEQLYAWNDFISNGQSKLLKSPDGLIFIISITDTPSYETEYKSGEYPTVISFSWIEIESMDDVTILRW